MNKKIISVILLSFILASCTTEKPAENSITEPEKNTFYIETKKISDFGNNITLKKSWKIESSQNITETSWVNWEISEILKQEWVEVKAWEIIVKIKDSNWIYKSNLDKTYTSLQNAKNTYDSTLLSLNKSINDTSIALDKLKKDLENAKAEHELSLKQAQDWVDNASLEDINSQASLNLQKLEKQLEKTEFDFETKKTTNIQTKNNFFSTVKNFIISTNNTWKDLITFSDKLFWISKDYKNLNDSYENYVSAKNIEYKNKAINQLKNLFIKQEEITVLLNTQINQDNILEIISQVYEYNLLLEEHTFMLKNVFNNSIEDLNFSETTINTYLAQVATYSSTVQGILSWIVTVQSSIDTFFKTYENWEISLQKDISLLKDQIVITKKDLETASLNAEIWLWKTNVWIDSTILALETSIINTQNSLENLIQNRKITISNLENQIRLAQITYNDALIQYELLTVKAPINGKISNIFIDKKQEVTIWTPLFKIVSLDTNQEINIWLSSSELNLLNNETSLNIEVNWKTLTWTILSISKTADQNLLYNVKILLEKWINLSWEVGEISFNSKSNSSELNYFPINIIEVTWSSKWYVNVFKDGNIEKLTLDLWKVIDDKVEIKTKIWNEIEIITNDVSKFNKNKHIPTIK